MTKNAFSDRPVHGNSHHLTKMLLVMKLTIVLLTAVFLNASASGISQTVTLTGNNISLITIFSAIERQTGYVVIANASLIDKAHLVTIHAVNSPLKEFLEQVFRNQPLQFSLKNTTIVISPKAANGSLSVGRTANPVGIPLSFPLLLSVFDAKGGTLSLATVTNKSTKVTGLTNESGTATLQVNVGDILQVSYIGYETFTYTVKENIQQLPVNMVLSKKDLDEVIYTAYGKTSKRLATGDIVKVTGEEIQRQLVMNPLVALVGKVPGLMVSQTTGFASSPVKVLLRGQLNLNKGVNSEPLYVIDGVPLSIINASGNYQLGAMGYDQSDQIWNNTPTRGMSPLFTINPMDIESLEVLKDADATAIYGAQGANGAILITTKKGKAGPVQLGLSIRGGFTKMMNRVEYLSTEDYFTMRRESFKNDGVTPTAITAPDLFLWDSTRNVKWQNELFGRAGVRTDYDLSLSGGSQQVNFRVSAGYSRATDISTISGATQRFTINSSTNYSSRNNKLSLALTFNYVSSNVNVKLLTKDPSLPPNAPPIYDSTGKLNWLGWLQGQDTRFTKISFPFGSVDNEYPTLNSNVAVNLQLQYSLYKGLKMSARFGYNDFNTQSNNFTPLTALNPLIASSTGRAGYTSTKGKGLTIEPTLNYVNQFGKGKLDVTLGVASKYALSSYSSLVGLGYTTDDLLHNISAATSLTASNTRAEHKFAGLFGILNYNLSNRYIINLNVRRDGSSKFGPGKRYGNFGSVGAAWIASDEPWMGHILPVFVSYLKLRGSFGVVGSDGVGDYQYISQWSPGVPALYSYGGIAPLKSLHAANPLFQWQAARKLSASLDMGFNEDKLSINVTYYRDRMGNQLVQFPIPFITGFNAVTANSPAVVQNKGLEFQLGATFIETAQFSWSGNFNLSLNRNKLVAFPNFEQSPFRATYQLGKPLNLRPLLHYTGIDPLTGDFSFQDRNHDGVIRVDYTINPGSSQDDRFWLDLTPKYFGGFSTQLTYKSFSLNMAFTYNRAIENNPLWEFVTGGTFKNLPKVVYNNVWKQPGDVAVYPRLMSMPPVNAGLFRESDGAFVEAFYVSFQNIQLQYRFNERIIKKMGVKACSFSIQTQELFSIALKGQYKPGSQNTGIPLARAIAANLNVNF